ncbi:CHAT domain-containing protein [Scytonema sp. HK-05]|uniref:CHAT domain-containing protein n=1 Tax=Scytonema sp. HK-05 TaxID=1137095 RepID=UPI0030764FCA
MPEVAALPWEFMRLPERINEGTIWLGTNPNVAFSRHQRQRTQAQPIQLNNNEKLRIALVVSAPKGLGKVEYKPVQTALEELAAKQPQRIELLPVVNQANREKVDAVLAKKPHVFHLIGHGRLKDENKQEVGQIAFVDEITKEADWIDAEIFGELFTRYRPGVVILQACEGAMQSESQAFVSVASKVVQQKIPVVVAMQYEVTNFTASCFADSFYEKLAQGEPVDIAVQEGRRTIGNNSTEYRTRDFATPVIFMQVRDGHLQPPLPDLNFVGREEAIAHLKTCVSQGAKVIVIEAAGGVGKTILAEQYLQTQEFDLVLRLDVAKETQKIAPVEREIGRWLQEYFDEKQVLEFDSALNKLRKKLEDRSKKIGILIDNLEPALDKSGKFIQPHRGYLELLRVLAGSLVQSLTLITSRERLHESEVTVQNYSLKGLSFETWQQVFNSRQIFPTNSPNLATMHKVYGGNAKAMRILSGAIQNDYAGNLEKYWQDNQRDLLIERDLRDLVTSQFNRLEQHHSQAFKLLCRLGCYHYQDIATVPLEGLLCLLWDVPESERQQVVSSLHDRFLVELVELNDKNSEYSLHPVIREEAIQRKNSENWEYVNLRAGEFYRNSAENLNNNPGEFYRNHAENLNNNFPNSTQAVKTQAVKYAFEAIEHFLEAQEFEKCYQSLLYILEAENNLENLRCSENLWSYTNQIIEVSKKLAEKLTGLTKAITLIPLGVLYPEIGKNYQAIKVSHEIIAIINGIKEDYRIPTKINKKPHAKRKIATKIMSAIRQIFHLLARAGKVILKRGKFTNTRNLYKKSKENDERLIFAEISAYLVSGRANKFIGNFSEALKACEKASKVAQDARGSVDSPKLNYWRALALYELGTVHLEQARTKESLACSIEAGKAEAGKALRCIGASAFLATNITHTVTQIPEEIYNFLNTPIEEVPNRLKSIIDNSVIESKNRDKDYTKKFRILHNIGRCLNSMEKYLFAEIVLNKALKILEDRPDNLNRVWSYLELASCYSARDKIKAQEYYNKALELLDEVPTLCKAFTLSEYGDFIYQQGLYREAVEKYQQLEICLKDTEFEYLKARNYYSICMTYLELSPDERDAIISLEQIRDYLEECKNISEKLQLNYLVTKVSELKRKIKEQILK